MWPSQQIGPRSEKQLSCSHLDDSVVDGRVLLLPQHHQGYHNHGRYDDTPDHQADDGAFVGAHVLGEEDLREEQTVNLRQTQKQ